jgi:antitoxin component YwqK of YwqJK toxin-antitoxin module
MRIVLILILCGFFSIAAFGQSLPDSGLSASQAGFTNKDEAKNLMTDGQREGKWCDYIKVTPVKKGDNRQVREEITTKKKKATFYRLAIYKDGKREGMVRTYNMDGTLEGEVMFVDGKQTGIGKVYYPNGKISMLTPFVDGKICGVKKVYTQKGQLVLADTMANEKENGVVILYDSNGSRNRDIFFTRDTVKGGTVNIPTIMTTLFKERITAEKTYYADGKLKSATNYTDFPQDGVTKRYDESGIEIK